MYRKVLGVVYALALLLLPLSAFAVGAKAMKERVEVAMRLTGTIDIEPDGSVGGVNLQDEDKVPAQVARFVRASVLTWAFEPVVRDGQAVAARTPVSLRVVGKAQGDGTLKVAIRDASFATYDKDSGESVTRWQMEPPRYPSDLADRRVQGEVFLLIRVGRDGHAQEVFAEQVNLRVMASERQLQGFSERLAANAVSAARKWQFRPPTKGPDVDDPYWVVRVPVNYSLDRNAVDGADYGRWEAYVPGQRQRAPWSTDAEWEGASDSLAAGGIYMAQDKKGPRLRTLLQEG